MFNDIIQVILYYILFALEFVKLLIIVSFIAEFTNEEFLYVIVIVLHKQSQKIKLLNNISKSSWVRISILLDNSMVIVFDLLISKVRIFVVDNI